MELGLYLFFILSLVHGNAYLFLSQTKVNLKNKDILTNA